MAQLTYLSPGIRRPIPGRVKDVTILVKNILSPKPCKSGEQDTSKLPNDLSS